MEERGAESGAVQDCFLVRDKQAQSMSRRVPVLVDACTRSARVRGMLRRVDRRAHRSVEGGSELDASRAWASPKDVYRASDAQARSMDVASTSTTGAGGASSPSRPALG